MSEQTNVAAPATAADIMRSPLTTVEQQAHMAAAAYLMKHAGTTALMVLNHQTGQPTDIITEADIAHAVADGKDLNSTRRIGTTSQTGRCSRSGGASGSADNYGGVSCRLLFHRTAC